MEHEELTEGVHFYFDDSGLMVLTQKYHSDRGYCCGNGCRHCPFDHEKAEKNTGKKGSPQKKYLPNR